MSELFNKCLDLAYDSHKGQVRKHSQLPYIIHPLQVCARLQKWGLEVNKEEILWSAAILHDVIEDTNTDRKCILDNLIIAGAQEKIADIVEELTFNESLKGEERRVEKKKYMESFFNSSLEALVIKVADRLCNIEDYYNFPDTRVYSRKYFQKGREFFDALFSRDEDVEKRFSKKVELNIEEDIESVTGKYLEQYK